MLYQKLLKRTKTPISMKTILPLLSLRPINSFSEGIYPSVVAIGMGKVHSGGGGGLQEYWYTKSVVLKETGHFLI